MMTKLNEASSLDEGEGLFLLGGVRRLAQAAYPGSNSCEIGIATRLRI